MKQQCYEILNDNAMLFEAIVVYLMWHFMFNYIYIYSSVRKVMQQRFKRTFQFLCFMKYAMLMDFSDKITSPIVNKKQRDIQRNKHSFTLATVEG